MTKDTSLATRKWKQFILQTNSLQTVRDFRFLQPWKQTAILSLERHHTERLTKKMQKDVSLTCFILVNFFRARKKCR